MTSNWPCHVMRARATGPHGPYHVRPSSIVPSSSLCLPLSCPPFQYCCSIFPVSIPHHFSNAILFPAFSRQLNLSSSLHLLESPVTAVLASSDSCLARVPLIHEVMHGNHKVSQGNHRASTRWPRESYHWKGNKRELTRYIILPR